MLTIKQKITVVENNIIFLLLFYFILCLSNILYYKIVCTYKRVLEVHIRISVYLRVDYSYWARNGKRDAIFFKFGNSAGFSGVDSALAWR